MAVVLAGTLVFALLGSHLIPDLTGPFAQERYGEVIGAGGDVVEGAAEHASQLGEQADSIAAGAGGDNDASGQGDGSGDGRNGKASAPARAAPEQAAAAAEATGPDTDLPPTEPSTPAPLPTPPPPEPAPEAPATTAPEPGSDPASEEEAEAAEADGECRNRPAGWPGCPEGSTQELDEFLDSQMDTRPPTDPDEIAASAAATSPSRAEISARVAAVKNPAPRDPPTPTAVAGSVTRAIDGDTLSIGGVVIDLSLVSVPPQWHDEAARHTRAACPSGSTAAYVPDTGRNAQSPDGTQRAKVWCFGPLNEPAQKSLNQELAEFGLASISADWQPCKGSSFYTQPWAKALGC